jgi:hypothetical protein
MRQGRLRAGLVGVLVGAVMTWIAATPIWAAQPPSAGCNATNADPIFGGPVMIQIFAGINVLRHNAAYGAGETLTISVDSVPNDGVNTVTIRDATNTTTVVSLLLSDGASASATIPTGLVGSRFVTSGVGFCWGCHQSHHHLHRCRGPRTAGRIGCQ